MSRIQHRQHQVSIGQRFLRFPDADALGFVVRVADAGCVHQLHEGMPPMATVSLTRSRGAGPRRHDGTLALHQPVKQARLAHVRPADDG